MTVWAGRMLSRGKRERRTARYAKEEHGEREASASGLTATSQLHTASRPGLLPAPLRECRLQPPSLRCYSTDLSVAYTTDSPLLAPPAPYRAVLSASLRQTTSRDPSCPGSIRRCAVPPFVRWAMSPPNPLHRLQTSMSPPGTDTR